MNKYILILFLLGTVSCTTTEATRRNYSASGDPEDIFFERSQKSRPTQSTDDSVAKSVLDDMNTTSKGTSEPKALPTKQANMSSFDEVGLSSWYGQKFQGRPTASGEPFDRLKLTGAHRTLPIGSVVKIQNLENQKEAVVRINDRGPFVDDRIVDVSEKTAELLEFKEKGVTKVGIKVLKKGESDDLDNDDSDLLDDAPAKPEKLQGQKPANQKLPVSAATATTAAVASAHSSTPKGFTVQVGVFKEQERAQKFKESMKSGYNEPVYVYPRDNSFVVQVGDFADRTKAEALKGKLKTDGIDCFIPPR